MSEARPIARARLALGLAVAACAAAAFWTSEGVAPWDGDRSNVWHHYEYLAEGFLHGQTSLSLEPPPELLRLKDPYDPATNGPWRLWDASLYKGRFYLYQGPTPALVLMLPWRALTGRAMPQRLAVAAFAGLGIAGLALLLGGIRRRHFPELSPLCLAAVVVVAFHASWLPVTLRRSGLWDLPVVAAVACLWWSLYLGWKFLDSGGRPLWAAGCGLALALLLGSRVSYLFAAMGIVALLLAAAGLAGPGRPRLWRSALPAVLLAAAGGVALLLYNRARFGNPFEFGLRYTMFGEDYRGLRFSNPAFIPFNAATYLFSVPEFGPYFPFLHPFWTGDLPKGFVGFEEMYGVLFMMPVHAAGLAGAAWALRRRAEPGARATVFAVSAGVLSSTLLAAVLFSWAWACSRFVGELLAGWTLATAVGLMAALGTPGGSFPRARRILAWGACIWSIACVWLASADFRGFMPETHPGTYATFAHVLDYPSLWAADLGGVSYGPVDLVVRVPAAGAGETALVASGRPQRANQVLLRRVDPAHAVVLLTENDHAVLTSPPIDVTGGTLRLTLTAPWLYPPLHHPYWDPIDPALASERQTLFALDWGTGSVRAHSTRWADPVAFEPAVRGASPSDPSRPWVESLKPARQR